MRWRMCLSKAGKIDFYRFCFQGSVFNGFPGTGHTAIFSSLAAEVILTPEEALDCFIAETVGSVCRSRGQENNAQYSGRR